MEGMYTNTTGEVLLDSAVMVHVADVGADHPTSTCRLNLLVKLEVKHSASKELLIRVTEEEDPMVLYTCIVREEDYPILKQRQGLLVNFAAFPHKFVELVTLCTKNHGKELPRFILIFRRSGEGGGATLEVVEPNDLKNLCHVALSLTPAPAHLKLTYLADCCKTLKAEMRARERAGAEKEDKLQKELHRCEEALTRTTREVNRLEAEIGQRDMAAKNQLAQHRSQEKEKMLKVQSDADRRVDRERREVEGRLKQHIDQLQRKVDSLTHHNQELTEKKLRAENSAKELHMRLNAAEEGLNNYRSDLTQTKRQNARLEQDNRAKIATVRELEGHVIDVERKLKDCDAKLTHLQEIQISLQQQKSDLEETVKQLEEKVSKKDSSIQLLAADLNKSLHIIKKFQKRIKEEAMMGEVQGAAIAKQEIAVTEKDTRISHLNEEVTALSSQVSSLTRERDQLQQELKEAVTKIQEQEKTLQTNEHMISWLNKQLNEVESASALAKRAPLTEVYQPSHQPFSSQPPMHRFMSHSTPLSTVPTPPTITGGWSGPAQSTLSSIRNIGIPPIPEEISPRGSHDSPPGKEAGVTDKENMTGLDPKYLEASRPGVMQVRGLLRAGYSQSTNTQHSVPDQETIGRKRAGMGINKRGIGSGRGGGTGRGTAVGGNKSRPSTTSQRPSSYFPKT
ncbi:hypothetical protein Pcinc_024177 [Petrolisthes cinctipes]|uniref:Spindle assembly abnormal protein 6 N-terminal domain-containing protein n=1 Tax=Petrolisthes cinctipes TaxID=88211 RepID=A0AAE1KDC3_PETCI|nr:hypothetical protein Pcinc_024177 [Petrolisthes cinctipes]